MQVIAVRIALLLAATALLFRDYIGYIVENIVDQPQNAHGLAIPLLIALLVWLRREDFAAAIARGRPSAVGPVLMVFGVLAFALATWPFNYMQIRLLCIMLFVAAALLTCGGWPLLRQSIPIVLLLALAIPIGTRYYARAVILPETLTLQGVEMLLGALPGVITHLDGLDIHFSRGSARGVVAVGEPNRGASLLITMAAIIIYLVASRRRTLLQLAAVALFAGPIMLLANFLRLLCWGIWNVYVNTDPIAAFPRIVLPAASLVFVAAIIGLLMLLCDRLVVRETNT